MLREVLNGRKFRSCVLGVGLTVLSSARCAHGWGVRLGRCPRHPALCLCTVVVYVVGVTWAVELNRKRMDGLLWVCSFLVKCFVQKTEMMRALS